MPKRTIVVANYVVKIESHPNNRSFPIRLAIANKSDRRPLLDVWITSKEAGQLADAFNVAREMDDDPTLADERPGEPEASDAVGGAAETYNEAVFAAAIKYSLPVAFRYAKGEGGHMIEQRRLNPGKIVEAHGHKLVVGYDPDRDEPRAYRLDRVRGLVNAV